MLNRDFLMWLDGYLAKARQGLSQQDVDYIRNKLKPHLNIDIKDDGNGMVIYNLQDGPEISC